MWSPLFDSIDSFAACTNSSLLLQTPAEILNGQTLCGVFLLTTCCPHRCIGWLFITDAFSSCLCYQQGLATGQHRTQPSTFVLAGSAQRTCNRSCMSASGDMLYRMFSSTWCPKTKVSVQNRKNIHSTWPTMPAPCMCILTCMCRRRIWNNSSSPLRSVLTTSCGCPSVTRKRSVRRGPF